MSQWLVQSCGMSLILINGTQKHMLLFKTKLKCGVLLAHMIGNIRVETGLSTLHSLAKLDH